MASHTRFLTVPHRMGAALTYARRYALFTLVGIAGEDDLDAPDLIAPTQKPAGPARPRWVSGADGRLDSGPPNLTAHTPMPRHGRADTSNTKARVLTAAVFSFEASARLREQMLCELNDIGSGDEAAKWARRRLPEKNKLNATDATHIEESFRAKLMSFAIHDGGELPQSEVDSRSSSVAEGNAPEAKRKSRTKPIDKAVLAHPEPRRIRDRNHVRFVAQQPCLICGRQPCDAHHLRFAQSRALDRKVSDEFTVPLCRGHHREVHRHGDEAAWWATAGVDPTVTARVLWLETHPLPANGPPGTHAENPRPSHPEIGEYNR